jgi:hypothetical protein
VLQLTVAGGNDDLEGVVVDSKPDRRGDRLAVPSRSDRSWAAARSSFMRKRLLGGAICREASVLRDEHSSTRPLAAPARVAPFAPAGRRMGLFRRR